VVVSCSYELAVFSCPLLCLQRQVAKLASRLCYCCSLLRNNNMATNLQSRAVELETKFQVLALAPAPGQWRIQTRCLGGSQIRGRQKVVTCLNTPPLCDNGWVSHKSTVEFAYFFTSRGLEKSDELCKQVKTLITEARIVYHSNSYTHIVLFCLFSNKYAFHVQVTAQVSFWKCVIVISLFMRLLAWTLSCHFIV